MLSVRVAVSQGEGEDQGVSGEGGPVFQVDIRIQHAVVGGWEEHQFSTATTKKTLDRPDLTTYPIHRQTVETNVVKKSHLQFSKEEKKMSKSKKVLPNYWDE